MQVKGIYPGEEKKLKAQARGMEERHTNVERCGIIRTMIEED